MATAQWLQDNPKILAYVSRDLHNRLYQFKKDHKIKSVSEAINLILKSFFELEMPLPPSAEEEGVFSQESAINSRIANLENVVRQLVTSMSGIEGNLPLMNQKPSIQQGSEESDLLLLDSKSLASQTVNPYSSQSNPLFQNQSEIHLSRKSLGNSHIVQASQNEDLDGEKISRSAFFEDILVAVLPDSPNNIQISDELIFSNSSIDFTSTVEGNLLAADQKPLTDQHFERDDLLVSNSKLLVPQASNPSSSQLSLLSQDQKETHGSQKNEEGFLIVQTSKNKISNNIEEVGERARLKGVLGLLNRDLVDSSGKISTLTKSILSNPSCVCFSVLKKSRLVSLIDADEGFRLRDIEDYFRNLKLRRLTPYYVIRDSLNKKIVDAKNPLNLDCRGENITIVEARDLAILVKQICKNDNVFQVYVISCSMLSRMLFEAGFPVTLGNFLKVRKYVEGIYEGVLQSLYLNLLAQAPSYRRGRRFYSSVRYPVEF